MPTIGNWEPTEEEFAAIQKASAEAFMYVLDTYYDIRDERIWRLLVETISQTNLVAVMDRYVDEAIKAWRDWDEEWAPRDIPAPPDGWKEVDDDLFADRRMVLRMREQAAQAAGR